MKNINSKFFTYSFRTFKKADGGIKVNGEIIKVYHETDPTKIGREKLELTIF